MIDTKKVSYKMIDINKVRDLILENNKEITFRDGLLKEVSDYIINRTTIIRADNVTTMEDVESMVQNNLKVDRLSDFKSFYGSIESALNYDVLDYCIYDNYIMYLI